MDQKPYAPKAAHCKSAATEQVSMQTVIVIPCLNEARLIRRTALSLGFGPDITPPADTNLILVDNGSTDDTWSTINAIRNQAPRGTVTVALEEARGYVPPRHRGAMIAQELATASGQPYSEVLILQGDADTLYEPYYGREMREAARAAGPNRMLEGRTHPPPRFLHDHPGFQKLADQIDAEMAQTAAPDCDDIIVDDKVAGFRLSDYLAWGGHRRDYMSTGAEVDAETTRLFIRAGKRGAERVQVDHAWAQPSRRKIQRNPVRHFATAGFPREEAWWRAWNAQYEGPNDLHAFDDATMHAALAPAIATRKAHLQALFSEIPQTIARWMRGLGAELSAEGSREGAARSFLSNDELGRFFELMLPGRNLSASN